MGGFRTVPSKMLRPENSILVQNSGSFIFILEWVSWIPIKWRTTKFTTEFMIKQKNFFLGSLFTGLFLLTSPALFAQVAESNFQAAKAQALKMPAFNGDLVDYLTENVQYPEQALKDSLSGRVLIKFLVTKEGKVANCQVMNSVAPILDDEALRVVKATSGQWIPGQLEGENTDIEYILPVVFSLEVSNSSN